jgi:tRNA (Thr-GGU) A37 N-methylase
MAPLPVALEPGAKRQDHATFSLRSPVRPNPIGTSIVRFEGDFQTG